MPLWLLALEFLLFLVGAVFSFRAYSRRSQKKFLVMGIIATFICFMDLVCVGLVLYFVSKIH